MPIAKYTPEAIPPSKPNTPKIAQADYKGVVVDTKYTPLSSLITFIEGSAWLTSYYSQVLNTDNDLRGQDTGQSAVYQQYTLINGMELKVTSPLTQNQDNEDARTTVSGTASVYPFLIPNAGDMFCADVGDGREGIFKIKTTDKKSFLQDASYSVEYDLIAFTNLEPARKQDLNDKVIKTVYFVKDFLSHGQNPLLVEEDFHAVGELDSKLHEITGNYFTWFFNKEKLTLLVPGQPTLTYDHYVTDAVMSIVNTVDHPQIKFVRRQNVDGDIYLSQPQLYKALINRDPSLISIGNSKMGLVNTRSFSNDPMLESIAYSAIRNIVYPRFPDRSIVVTGNPRIVDEITLLEPIEREDFVALTPTELLVDLGESNTTAIYKIGLDETYVLSLSFYNDLPTKSLLELLTKNYLINITINPSILLKLLTHYKRWGLLEKFYYLPIVMILIKSVIRGT